MYSIVNIIKHWVTKPHCKLDTNILARIGKFAMSIQSSETTKRLAKELHLAVVEHRLVSQSGIHAFPTKQVNPQVQARGHHSHRSSPNVHISLNHPQIPDSPPGSSMPTQNAAAATTTTHNDPPLPEFKLTVKPKSHAHLMTPPLTPFSSLKSDSSGGGTAKTNVEHVPASRFLVVSPALHV